MSAEGHVLRSPARGRWAEVLPWWGLLAAIGAAAWIYAVGRSRDMGIGPGTMQMAFWLFIGMWAAMMAAMMLPAIGPLAAEESRTTARPFRGASRAAGILAFGVGFLVPWAVYGAGAFVVLLGTGRLATHAPGAARWLGVGIFAMAGIYQFTPLKQRALAHCRAPMGLPAGWVIRTGVLAGARDGLICVACCWALMAVFFATGVMSMPTMVGLAIVILGEKLLPTTRSFSMAVGLVLIGLAVTAAVHPTILGGLRPTGAMQMGTAPGPMGGM